MNATTRIVLTRHGQARCNVDGRLGGPKTCTGLTDLGRRQVGVLAERLASEHRAGPAFDVLYAGTRARLQESGRILAAALGLPLLTDPGLDGLDHGQGDGMLWSDVETAFHGAPHAHPDQPYAPGSDTWLGFLARGTGHLAALIERQRGRNVLIAAHGETIQAACHLLLEVPHEASAHLVFATGHACVTRFELHHDRFGQASWVLSAHNDTAHLSRPPG
ncbi:histidine phosphatase family protein [Streptomyces sp. NPDC058290]|uniref:histidine phosphatase family protein n=1 Tax=Streptomyces sp. NPDC058290 TaxID=3346426 RepID=UPI0036E8FD14